MSATSEFSRQHNTSLSPFNLFQNPTFDWNGQEVYVVTVVGEIATLRSRSRKFNVEVSELPEGVV